MSVNYTKLDITSKEVVELSTKTGFPVKEVCAILNNQRYRKAYNVVKQEREKLLKEALKEVK